MSVLVTGGAGYVGGHFALALADAGEPVVVLDDLSTGSPRALPPGVPLVQGDVGDQALVRRTLREHRVDVIAHFAAKTVVPDSVADPLAYYAANTLKTHALLSAAVAEGVDRFLFSSTAAVYGEIVGVSVPEDARPSPLSPYGTSKLMAERMVQDVSQAHGLRHVILRYFNVAGADPRGRWGQSTPRATHLIKVAVEAALGVRPGLEIFGDDYPTRDGTGVRDYIHVADLAEAHLAAVRHLRAGGADLLANCGYGRGYSVREVVEAVRRAAGAEFPVTTGPRRPGDAACAVASAERLRDVLGWTPRYDDLDVIVGHALSWERRLRAG